jgi:uncharacterized membrane protein
MNMTLGPVQFMAIGFGAEAEFKGEILDELDRLTDRGLIRVLDVGLIRKTEAGEVIHIQASGLTAEEVENLGGIVKNLFGASAGEQVVEQAVDLAETSLMAELEVGVAFDDLDGFVAELEPGESVGILLIEHVWAKRFREIARLTGGVLLFQGFLTPELTMAVGAELEAISEAAAAVEISESVKGAAFLDALRTVEAAEAIKAEVTADVVRTLMVAGLLEDAAVTEAVNALYSAELIEEAALLEAETAVAEMEAEVADAMTYLAE